MPNDLTRLSSRPGPHARVASEPRYASEVGRRALRTQLPDNVTDWQMRHFGWIRLATLVPPGILARLKFQLYSQQELRNRIRACKDRHGQVLLPRKLQEDEIDFLVWLYDRWLRIGWKQHYDIRQEVLPKMLKEPVRSELSTLAPPPVVVQRIFNSDSDSDTDSEDETREEARKRYVEEREKTLSR